MRDRDGRKKQKTQSNTGKWLKKCAIRNSKVNPFDGEDMPRSKWAEQEEE